MREYDIEGVTVQVVRKRVKNLNLHVRARDGQVVASAPEHMPWSTIEGFLQAKRNWIVREHGAALSSKRLAAEQASEDEQRAWRVLVQASTEMLVEKWESVLGVRAGRLAYRNMRSRWGSCRPETGRICINTRLALYPPRCIEYVVVHELCHLRVPGHGPEFKALLDRYLPEWRTADALLKR